LWRLGADAICTVDAIFRNTGADTMAANTDANSAETELHAQLRQLREQVETLINERARPALTEAAHRAEDAMQKGRDVAQDQLDHVSSHVRSQPITSVLVAAAIGFVIGRLAK
jgi:ElaB/YqjD/DUF883 family membrane-anchored ribosome-binding protein